MGRLGQWIPEFATIEDNSGVWMSDVGNQSHCAHKAPERSGYFDLYCFKTDILIFLSNVQLIYRSPHMNRMDFQD